MPLILLGILVLLGVLIYAVIQYMNSGEADLRPVRERYPQYFTGKKPAGNGDDSSGTGNDDSAESTAGNTAGGASDAQSGSQPDEDGVIHPETRVYTDNLRGDLDHLADDIKDDVKDMIMRKFGFNVDAFLKDRREGSSEGSEDDDDTNGSDPIIFPTENVEAEKKKRNIH